MICDGKKWSEVLMEKVYMSFILPLCAVFVAGVMMARSSTVFSRRLACERVFLVAGLLLRGYVSGRAVLLSGRGPLGGWA